MPRPAQAWFCFHEVNSGSDSWPALWKHPVTPQHNIANPRLLLVKCNFKAKAQAAGFQPFMVLLNGVIVETGLSSPSLNCINQYASGWVSCAAAG